MFRRRIVLRKAQSLPRAALALVLSKLEARQGLRQMLCLMHTSEEDFCYPTRLTMVLTKLLFEAELGSERLHMWGTSKYLFAIPLWNYYTTTTTTITSLSTSRELADMSCYLCLLLLISSYILAHLNCVSLSHSLFSLIHP